MKIKNTDLLAEVLRDAGIADFFAVTGGAAVHIIDSLVTKGNMNAVFHHHEQAAALAADAYARLRNLGVCVVTTGPGVTNALTGLLCSWQDSVPTIFISGQARYSLTGLGASLRQVGTQQLEVIPIVQHLTKKAVMLKPGDSIQEVISELIEIAQSGRKGPVWLDIPLDLQIEEGDRLVSNPKVVKLEASRKPKMRQINTILKDLNQARRPLILLGRGITGVKQADFNKAIKFLGIPCLRTWGFLDSNLVIPKSLDFGVVGVSGQRGANKIISESDFVLSLGARLGQAVVGPIIQEFAPKAKLHIIDIDLNELDRVKVELPQAITHNGDAGKFLMSLEMKSRSKIFSEEWINYCSVLKSYNFEQTLNADKDAIDQYSLFKLLDKKIPSQSIIVIDGGGTIVYCSMQVLRLIPNRKIIIPSASAPMGTGIPQAIGAQMGSSDWSTIVVCGDGSLPFNMQEIQTIKTNKLPIKILIVNNNGYLSIQSTQDQFLQGRHLGSSEQGGLEIPNFKNIVDAFGLVYSESRTYSSLDEKLSLFLKTEGSAVLEVFIKQGQQIYPRTGFIMGPNKKFSPLPLSDMHPKMEIPSFK